MCIKARQRNYRKPAKKFTLIKNKLLKLAWHALRVAKLFSIMNFFIYLCGKWLSMNLCRYQENKRKIKKKFKAKQKMFEFHWLNLENIGIWKTCILLSELISNAWKPKIENTINQCVHGMLIRVIDGFRWYSSVTTKNCFNLVFIATKIKALQKCTVNGFRRNLHTNFMLETRNRASFTSQSSALLWRCCCRRKERKFHSFNAMNAYPTPWWSLLLYKFDHKKTVKQASEK